MKFVSWYYHLNCNVAVALICVKIDDPINFQCNIKNVIQRMLQKKSELPNSSAGFHLMPMKTLDTLRIIKKESPSQQIANNPNLFNLLRYLLQLQ